MAKTEWRRGSALDENLILKLRERIKAGADLAKIAAQVGVSAATLTRAAAGLSLRNASAQVIRMAFEKQAA